MSEKNKTEKAENLPEGWKLVSIEKDSILISGLRPKGGALDEGIPSIGGEHITTNGRINFFGENARYIPEKFFRLMKKGKAEKYDILINKAGANTGKVAILKEKFYPDIAINENLFILRSKGFFDQRYLFYLIFSHLGQKQIKSLITGSAQPGLSSSFTKRFFALKPPLPEQHRIAEILETVDNVIEKTDAIIEKYKRIKQGLMQDLLTKGIDENGKIRSEQTHKFKDSPLGRIPEEWEVVRLGEVIEIFDNKRVPLDEEYRSSMKGEFPYCGATGIIDYINDFIFDGEFVLIAEDGGKFKHFEDTSYLMKGKFWANNHIHIVSGKTNLLNNSFLKYFMNYEDIGSYISGSTREKLNQQLLKNILLLLPPLPEQHKIAEILETVDNVIEKEVRYKEKLERLKRGLMEDLLTGKVRVNDLIDNNC